MNPSERLEEKGKHFGRAAPETDVDRRAQRSDLGVDLDEEGPGSLAGEDGKHKWFETILVDTQHPNITKNPKMRWASSPANRKRALR